MPMKLSIIIPAHNEERRIGKTLHAYHQFFIEKKQEGKLDFELVVVLNGCTDNTIDVVTKVEQALSNVIIIDLPQAGKGIAIKAGFADALKRSNDLIGFVDADMATSPQAFYDLINNIAKYDGVIASRYMPGSRVFPSRPRYKRWGSRIIFEPLVWLLLGLSYYDLQCGAKLFKRHVVEKITPQLLITHWAIDIELLYLCKRHGFTIKEFPTIWYDQEDSKMTIRGGFRMLGAIVTLRLRYSPLKFLFR